MSFFKSSGFDTLIGAGTMITGTISIAPNTTFVLDGDARCISVHQDEVHVGDKVAVKTTLIVNGKLSGTLPDGEVIIDVHNVTIGGKITCEEIRVEGTLHIKAGGTLNAKKILYRDLVIEQGALMQGNLLHLDHVSEGEQI